MPMERHGRNAWRSAMRFAIRTPYSRTSSGVLTSIVLLDLPLTPRNALMLVYLAVVSSLKLAQRKLLKFGQRGYLSLSLFKNLHRRHQCQCQHQLTDPVQQPKMYLAHLHSESILGNKACISKICILHSESSCLLKHFTGRRNAATYMLLRISSVVGHFFCRQKILFLCPPLASPELPLA